MLFVDKISVMIVDDEKLAIDDFINIVDWEANGFSIVATAFNGKQAFNKFREYRPQVVFSDIKMPYMDGIELIQNIRKIDKTTKIFLLTAYQDFAYAKSAISYGISDYIIKSEIKTKYITNLLDKIKGLIDQESEAANMLTQKTILDFLYSQSDDEDINNPLLFSKSYYYSIIEQDFPIDIIAKNSIDYFRHNSTDVIDEIREIVPEGFNIVAINRLQMEQILIVLDPKETSRSKNDLALKRYTMKIRERIKERFNESFTIYFSSTSLTLQEVKKRMPDMQKTPLKVFNGTGKTLPMFADKYKTKTKDVSFDSHVLDDLVQDLDKEGTEDYIRKQIQSCIEDYDFEALYVLLRKLYSILEAYNSRLPMMNQLEISAEENQSYWYNGPDLRDWMIRQFSMLVLAKQKISQNEYSKTVLKVMTYVDKHFAEESLSIHEIAEHVHLSVGHLCSLFKKETNTTIKSYITHIRIEHAKQLLEASDRKIYDIAEAVGYHSSQYFSQVYYRMTGRYPSDYQKRG